MLSYVTLPHVSDVSGDAQDSSQRGASSSGNGRVPGKLDVDHRVRRLQVQPGRAGTRRQEQAAAGIALKFVDEPLPERVWRRGTCASTATEWRYLIRIDHH